MKIRQSIISDNTIATTADNTLAESMITKKPRREIRDISTHGSFDPKYARLKSQRGAQLSRKFFLSRTISQQPIENKPKTPGGSIMRAKMFDQTRATLETLMKEFDFGMDETSSPDIWIARISDAANNLKDLYVDESKPLIHNEFLYKSVIKSTFAYFKHIVSKYETME